MAKKTVRSGGPETLHAKGVTTLELLVAAAIIAVIVAIAFPNVNSYLQNYRIAGDTKAIASQLALARMRSAGDFDLARVSINSTTNAYELDLCNKATQQFAIEGSPHSLSSGVSYGFGTITVSAGGYQTSIAQTAPITFNSRSIPVVLAGSGCSGCNSSCTKTPTGNNTIYLTNGERYYAIVVNPGGKIDTCQYLGGSSGSCGAQTNGPWARF